MFVEGRVLISNSDNVAKLNPVPTTSFVPMRSVNRALNGATTSMIAAHGNSAAPARSAENPMTLWRYCVRRNVEPNIAKKMSMMPKLAAENRGFSNTWRLSIGWVDLSSHHANAESTTTAIANAAMIVLLVHP